MKLNLVDVWTSPPSEIVYRETPYEFKYNWLFSHSGLETKYYGLYKDQNRLNLTVF